MVLHKCVQVSEIEWEVCKHCFSVAKKSILGRLVFMSGILGSIWRVFREIVCLILIKLLPGEDMSVFSQTNTPITENCLTTDLHSNRYHRAKLFGLNSTIKAVSWVCSQHFQAWKFTDILTCGLSNYACYSSITSRYSAQLGSVTQKQVNAKAVFPTHHISPSLLEESQAVTEISWFVQTLLQS